MTDSSVNNRRVLLQSLGCKTNQYENDALAAAFLAAGFLPAEPDLPVDVVVLNTCTVTGEAGRKSRQMLRRLRLRYPEAIVVASGCHAQVADLSAFADLTFGTAGRDHIVAEVQRMLADGSRAVRVFRHDPFAYETIAPVSLPSETRAYVKIEDGCDNRCTYCAIRLARGPARSRPPADILAEIEALAAAGHYEVVLTGTHIGSYGKGESYSLIDLLEGIEETPVGRFRLGSLEPETLSAAFVERAAKLTRLCPHFHLSLQSGSNAVLQRMARRYTAERYRQAVERALAVWPQLGLTTDVMVAFPGETAAEHVASVAFLQSLPFTDFHVFRFSPRHGTVAAGLPDQVPPEQARTRSAEMEALAALKRAEAVRQRLGAQRRIVVEKTENACHYGYSEDYLYLAASGDGSAVQPGMPLDVIVSGWSDGQALATVAINP